MESWSEYIERKRNDPRTTDEIVEDAAAAENYRDSDDDVLRDLYWDPLRTFTHRAIETSVATAKKLLSKKGAADRILGADILSVLFYADQPQRDTAAELLLPVFSAEADDGVLKAIAWAFGSIKDERAIPRLVGLSRHRDASVRFNVVRGLLGLDNHSAVAALIVLSADPNDDVRNWATFGLGSQTTLNTPELRDALVARLHEEDDEIRGEAFVGLAERGDPRVIPALLRELRSTPPDVLRDWVLILDSAEAIARAATRTGGKEWLPVLKKLRTLEIGDRSLIEAAIVRCSFNNK